jgi:NADPH:quinone reductase
LDTLNADDLSSFRLPIKPDLSWEEFAVIPESYATAWTCLHRNLEIKEGQTLVIMRRNLGFGSGSS